MSGFAFVALFIGFLTLIGLFLWVRQREETLSLSQQRSFREANGETDAYQSAVIVATPHGQVIHVNHRIRDWLHLDNLTVPNLEEMSRMAQPAENFFSLLADEAQTSFQFGDRWVEATSHYVPSAEGDRMVVAMKELRMQPASTADADSSLVLDVSLTMRLIEEIGDSVDASMGMELCLQVLLDIINRAIPADAGEIALYDEQDDYLYQRGWVGDTRYLLSLAEHGGGYRPGEGTAGWVAQHRQPLLISSNHPEMADLMDVDLYRSVVAIPLTAGERLIGTLSLFHEAPDQYSGADVALLRAISKAVTTTIYNAELYTRQEERIRDIASIQQIAAQPADDQDASPIYALLNERMANLLNADICGIFLYDSERSALIPQLPFHGLQENIASMLAIPLPNHSAQHEIWRNQAYWISNDLLDEPLLETVGLKPIVDVTGIHNTAIFPLEIGGVRIGAVAISNKRGGNFTPGDIQNLRVLSTQAAIVVENVRLYQRERLIDTELVGLQEMTHAIGALSHEGEFYSEITERIARLTSSTMCGILLYDEQAQKLVSQLPFYGVSDDLMQHYSIPVLPGTVMGQLWDEEDFWYSNRINSDALVYEAKLDRMAEAAGVVRTLIAVMIAGGRRIGVVQVSNKVDDSDYNDKDARLLQIFATQAAAIIENARLFREIQVRANQADQLRRIAEMSGTMLTTEQTFQPVLAEIAGYMQSPVVYINVVDQTTNTLITYPRWTTGIQLEEPIIQDMSAADFADSVVLSGKPFYTNDVPGDERVLPGYRNVSMRYNLVSSVLVPLVVGDRTLGELGVSNRESPPYSSDDVTALGTIASQIAAALDRLLIYEATGENLRHRMEELDAISRISNELSMTRELDRVLEVILEEAEKATYALGSSIALLRPRDDWEAPDKPRMERRIGQDLGSLSDIEAEAVIRGVEPVLVANYDESPLGAAPMFAGSGVAAPIDYLDDVIGVIYVYHTRHNAFGDRVAGFLMTLSSKASLGYQSYAYYQQQVERSQRLRQRVDQLNRIFDLGQMLQNTMDPQEVMEAIAYSVQQSVGFDVVLMTLFDEHGVLHRAAHAGLPLSVFEETKDRTLSYDSLPDVMQDAYAISESYFFPIEEVDIWYNRSFSALSVSFEGNRSMEAGSSSLWRDGDMLLVKIIGQGGNVLGIMSLDRPYSNMRPDRSVVEILEIFAHQASTMLENIRLFSKSRRSASQEQRLSVMLEAIASTLDLREIAGSIAEGLRGLLPFYRMTLALSSVDDERGFEYLRAVVQDDGQIAVNEEQRTTLERTALGRSFEERVAYAYVAGERAVQHYDDLQNWYARGEKSTYIMPLTAGGTCLGVLHIGSHDPDRLTDEESQQLLNRISQLVASAVQNARLYNQASNLEVLNRSVVESIQQGIVVLDNSGRILRINDYMETVYSWDREAARRKDLFAYRPEISEFIKDDLREVLEIGEPRERINQTSPDKSGEPIVRNFYIYPLRFGEQIRGAVMLVEDVTDRVRMEEAMETRANQLAALTDVSTRITASLEREEVVSLAIDEMGWIIPYDMMSLWRRNGSFMVLEGHSDPDLYDEMGSRVLIGELDKIQELVDEQHVVSVSSDVPLRLPFMIDDLTIHSWMGVPLVNQGHVVGMMVLAKAEPGFYETRQEKNVAFAFASQVAIAQANADLFEQTFERTNELGTLLEAAQATSLTRDLKDVFNIVAELMFSALEMETCSIMIFDEVDNELEVRFAVDRMGDVNLPQPVGTRYRLDDYPSRDQVINQREVLAIVNDDSDEDMPYPEELAALQATGYGARMLVPLVVRDQAIGMLQLDHSSADQQSLTQQKVRMARALGSQVAIEIYNARLSDETNARLEELLTINSLSQKISSTLNLDDILPIVRAQVPSLTTAEEMYVALYEPDTELITFPLAVREGTDFTIPPRQLNMDEVSYVIRRGHTLNLGSDYFSIDNLRHSMKITAGEGNVTSYMGVPLKSGDEVLGVLAIRSQTRKQAFNLNDDRILTTIGSQLGAAIQNARLYARMQNLANDLEQQVEQRTEELEEERDRLDTLYQITSELARTLDMEQLLGQALGMVSKAVGAQDGVIMLTDPATDRLFCRAWLNPNHLYYEDNDVDKATPLHAAEGLASWLLLNGELGDHVEMVDNLLEQPYWDDNARQTGMRSALAVMLESNEDPMGVMVLLSQQEKAFTESHLKLLVPAANQVASSINSADLYQLIREQAQRLGKLLRDSQEEAQKNSAILESITDGVMLANSDGKIVLFNSAAERILQLPREQALNQSVAKLAGVYGTSAAKWSQMVREWSASPEIHDIQDEEFVVERLEIGDYIISVYLSPVYINDLFLGTVSVFRDITRDVETDRVKSEFIENVSHEFRTPLTPIKGYTDLLLMGAGGQLSDMQSNFVTTIKENVDRLTVLVNDVLNIAKLDRDDLTLTMQQVDISDVVHSVVDQISTRAFNVEKNITLTIAPMADLPLIRADNDKLRQIMINVIDNAFNYTPAGGKIDIEAHLEPGNKSVLISVADSGVGIPEEFQEAAWRRFERYDEHALKLEIAGTGLGLPLVRELVTLHNGEAWLESELNVGTTVFIRLPVEQPHYITETIEMIQIDGTSGD